MGVIRKGSYTFVDTLDDDRKIMMVRLRIAGLAPDWALYWAARDWRPSHPENAWKRYAESAEDQALQRYNMWAEPMGPYTILPKELIEKYLHAEEDK